MKIGKIARNWILAVKTIHIKGFNVLSLVELFGGKVAEEECYVRCIL